MARKKKLSTEELSKNREDLVGQWNAIAQKVEEIDNELSSRELKESYDKKHLKEIQKKYTGKIIMPKKNVSTFLMTGKIYSLNFYVVDKIVPDSTEKFNIIGKYISVRHDGDLTNVTIGGKDSLYPYLGLQSYKEEKEVGYEIVTPQEMVDLIKQFKEVVVERFNNSIDKVTKECLPIVTKKLPKKSKKPLTKKK